MPYGPRLMKDRAKRRRLSNISLWLGALKFGRRFLTYIQVCLVF
jgi:hypothetical protein